MNQKAGFRFNAARAFPLPAKGRRNLRVMTGALAERILLEGSASLASISALTGNPRAWPSARS